MEEGVDIRTDVETADKLGSFARKRGLTREEAIKELIAEREREVPVSKDDLASILSEGGEKKSPLERVAEAQLLRSLQGDKLSLDDVLKYRAVMGQDQGGSRLDKVLEAKLISDMMRPQAGGQMDSNTLLLLMMMQGRGEPSDKVISAILARQEATERAMAKANEELRDAMKEAITEKKITGLEEQVQEQEARHEEEKADLFERFSEKVDGLEKVIQSRGASASPGLADQVKALVDLRDAFETVNQILHIVPEADVVKGGKVDWNAAINRGIKATERIAELLAQRPPPEQRVEEIPVGSGAGQGAGQGAGGAGGGEGGGAEGQGEAEGEAEGEGETGSIPRRNR